MGEDTEKQVRNSANATGRGGCGSNSASIRRTLLADCIAAQSGWRISRGFRHALRIQEDPKEKSRLRHRDWRSGVRRSSRRVPGLRRARRPSRRRRRRRWRRDERALLLGSLDVATHTSERNLFSVPRVVLGDGERCSKEYSNSRVFASAEHQ